jgi:hypothetical protein
VTRQRGNLLTLREVADEEVPANNVRGSLSDLCVEQARGQPRKHRRRFGRQSEHGEPRDVPQSGSTRLPLSVPDTKAACSRWSSAKPDWPKSSSCRARPPTQHRGQPCVASSQSATSCTPSSSTTERSSLRISGERSSDPARKQPAKHRQCRHGRTPNKNIHRNSKGLINYYINSQIPFPANSNQYRFNNEFQSNQKL